MAPHRHDDGEVTAIHARYELVEDADPVRVRLLLDAELPAFLTPSIAEMRATGIPFMEQLQFILETLEATTVDHTEFSLTKE